jgi:pilus assembly protein TadC
MMRKNILIKTAYVLSILFVIYTAAVVLIVYKIIDLPFSLGLIIGYIVFLILCVLYFIVLTAKNIRRLNKGQDLP